MKEEDEKKKKEKQPGRVPIEETHPSPKEPNQDEKHKEYVFIDKVKNDIN